MSASEGPRKEPVEEIAISEVRDRLTELVDRAKYTGQATVITRNGKRLGAIVGLDRTDPAFEEFLERLARDGDAKVA